MQDTYMTAKQIDQYLGTLATKELESALAPLKMDRRATVQKIVSKYIRKIENASQERKRLQMLCQYENALFEEGLSYVAGVDEAGRGPLAGPVFAAAVIFSPGTIIEQIDDSKRLSAKKREALYEAITKRALDFGIAHVSEQEIDHINIKNATILAMHRAIQSLKVRPQHLLVDGIDFETIDNPYTNIIKGDSLSISIAAASILAKVSRDRYIDKMAAQYPQYGFLNHKGYGTKEHIEAIKQYGICPIHRKTFTTKF